jgi:hypothetical protein
MKLPTQKYYQQAQEKTPSKSHQANSHLTSKYLRGFQYNNLQGNIIDHNLNLPKKILIGSI